MGPVQRIAVGVASYRRPEGVLSSAHEIAKPLGAQLHVVHAYSRASPIEDEYEILGYRRSDVFARYEDFARAQLEAMLASTGSVENIVYHFEEGAAECVLNDIATRVNADLIVVGATRRGRVGQQLLGTTAERTIRSASAPVLVLRQPLSSSALRVLFAVDLSELGARVYHRGVHLLHALFGSAQLGTRAVLVVPFLQLLLSLLDQQEVEALARHELRRMLEQQDPANTSAEVRVRLGAPAPEILREAKEWKADILALGTHARSGIERLALGSVAATVAREATSSVLVIPPHWELAGSHTADSSAAQLLFPRRREAAALSG